MSQIEEAQATKHTATALPAEGLVGVEVLINQPPRGNRPKQAGVLGIGRSLFYEQVAKGEIKIKKIGRRTFMNVADVREFIKAA